MVKLHRPTLLWLARNMKEHQDLVAAYCGDKLKVVDFWVYILRLKAKGLAKQSATRKPRGRKK